MTSTQRTILVVAVAAAAVIGAGVYFSPKKAALESASGTVAPAVRYKADKDGGTAPQGSGLGTQQASQQSGSGIGKGNVSQQGSGGVGQYNNPDNKGESQGVNSLSDRRLKSNIVRIGTHPLGIGLYEYDIFGERQRGVMADEVEQVMPEAVTTHPTLGYKMVRYDLLSQH